MNRNRWIEAGERGFGGVSFELAYRVRAVKDLAMEVRGIHTVKINDADMADAGGGEVKSRRGTQAPHPDTEDLGSTNFLLANHAQLGQNDLPRIPPHSVCVQFHPDERNAAAVLAQFGRV